MYYLGEERSDENKEDIVYKEQTEQNNADLGDDKQKQWGLQWKL